MKSFIRNERCLLYVSLIRHWTKMLFGKSYWHVNQGVGHHFVPGQLLGYYNDLTAKTKWIGQTDGESLPLNEDSNGNLIYFPTTLFQKALGHWDRWIESKETDINERTNFLKLAEWSLRNQDDNGGWSIWPSLGLRYASSYSAMTQGEAASVLVRAALINQDNRYYIASRRAIELMLTPMEQGGVCRYTHKGMVLEEAPLVPHNTMLNGWIFAIYGLYDYFLLAKIWDKDTIWIEKALYESIQSLLAHLPLFNAGFWSYYDTFGNISSPFYQKLHISQLKALEMTFPEHENNIRRWRQLFEQQANSSLNTVRAVTIKAFQKLLHPPKVVLR